MKSLYHYFKPSSGDSPLPSPSASKCYYTRYFEATLYQIPWVFSGGITPPFIMNNEQVELIFFGKWPTVLPAFITFTAKGSCTLANSRQHESISSSTGVHSSWYAWYPLIHVLKVVSQITPMAAMLRLHVQFHWRINIIGFIIFTNFVMVTKLFFTKFFFHYKMQNFTKILYYKNLELYGIRKWEQR